MSNMILSALFIPGKRNNNENLSIPSGNMISNKQNAWVVIVCASTAGSDKTFIHPRGDDAKGLIYLLIRTHRARRASLNISQWNKVASDGNPFTQPGHRWTDIFGRAAPEIYAFRGLDLEPHRSQKFGGQSDVYIR